MLALSSGFLPLSELSFIVISTPDCKKYSLPVFMSDNVDFTLTFTEEFNYISKYFLSWWNIFLNFLQTSIGCLKICQPNFCYSIHTWCPLFYCCKTSIITLRGEGDISSFPPRVLLAGWGSKLTWDRITVEKTQSFIMCSWKSNNEIATQTNEQGRQFLYFLDKEKINLWGIARIKKTCLGALISKKF